MFTRNKICFVIIMLLFMGSSPCYASTDWVVNVIDTANGILKDVTQQYEAYSTQAQKFITAKTGKIGDFNLGSKLTQKLKAVEERVAKKAEHLEKLKKRMDERKKRAAAKIKRKMDALEKAKEKANAYASQAQEYASQAQEYASQAQEYASQAQEYADDVGGVLP